MRAFLVERAIVCMCVCVCVLANAQVYDNQW
jgi:hypothetical protein